MFIKGTIFSNLATPLFQQKNHEKINRFFDFSFSVFGEIIKKSGAIIEAKVSDSW